MWRSALAVLFLVGTTQAQVNRSSVPPPFEKADPQAREFLDRGLAILKDGDAEVAATVFADGLLKFGTVTSAASNDSMVHIALNHASAVANLRINKAPAARLAIDRALLSRWTNDSLTFNAATVYVANRTSAITAVNLLDKYLAAHPDADESWVNLFGLALEKATTDAASRQKLEARYKTLAENQTRLEAKTPGKHRWGSELLDESEWTQIKSKKDEADKKLAELQAAVDTAQKNLQQAQQAQQAAASASARQSQGGGGGGGRRGRGGGGGGGGGGQRGGGGGGQRGGSAAAVTSARDQLTEAQKALDEADRGPQPKWDVQLIGIQPVVEMTLK